MSNYTDFQYGDDTNKPWFKIKNLVVKDSRVLDIGCSSGNLGQELIKEKKCEVVGIDLDRDDVELAKSKLSKAFVANIETDDIGHLGKFDYIIFADVIEHLSDPVNVLEKITPLLTPKGSILFSIPNMAHMSTRLMLLGGKFNYGEIGLLDKTHMHFYDKEEIERVFGDAGYSINQLEWVERYLPDDLVIQQLSELGLVANTKFLEMNKKIESLAYEYIGRASVGTKTKTKKLDFISPYSTETEERIADIHKASEDKLKKYKEQIQQELQELKIRNKELQTQNDIILSSFIWRISRPYRSVRRKIRKAK